MKKINEHREFFTQEETKLIQRFNGKVDESGMIKFEDLTQKTEFVQAHTELLQSEIQDLEPIVLNFEKLSNCELAPGDFLILDGIVTFQE